MKASYVTIVFLWACASFAWAQSKPATTQARTKFPRPDVKYEHGPDAKRKDGVPRGKIETFTFKDSRVFPGTIRRCAVDVPAQYRSEERRVGKRSGVGAGRG